MKKTLIVLFLIAPLFISISSAMKVIGNLVKITINTDNKDSKIILDNGAAGTGSVTVNSFKGVHQIELETPGYKNSFHCMFSSKGVENLTVSDKITSRKENEKFIEVLGVKMNIKDKKRGVISENLNWENDINAAIIAADEEEQIKETDTEGKENNNNKKGADLKEDKERVELIAIENVYTALKKSGFTDTVNKIFADNNNILVLEGEVKKVVYYKISLDYNSYQKTKLDLVWYIKNSYNEILDSIITQTMSGDFGMYSTYYNNYKSSDFTSKMFADAIEISYLNLHKNPIFTKYINQENSFNITDPILSLVAPKNTVTDKSDASIASVIVKTDKGHGSGFAITQNGFIITNYHVIAEEIADKPNSIKIITANGDELEGKVVRVNKFRDLALIKVDVTFEKVFKLSSEKTFTNLQDVYTIGTPKSVELGQSVSWGVISNERKNNNNNLLQLGMSVNGGNSGGPVFDKNGTLHGVIESKLIGNNTEGVAFAIPAYLIPEYLNITY